MRKRMAEFEKILNKLYEDLVLERITESRYQAMAPRYEAEQAELMEKENGVVAGRRTGRGHLQPHRGIRADYLAVHRYDRAKYLHPQRAD